MNSIPWLSIYMKGGLWGCLKHFARENHIVHWGIFINFTHCKYFIDPYGKPRKEKYNYGHQIRIIQNSENKSEIFIPIGIGKNILFIWHFLSKVKFSEKQLDQIKFQIELLILHEASNIDIYPTFLTFLYPLSDVLSDVNESIRHKKNYGFIFLNGQRGSGKASFAQCFTLLHFNYFFNFNSMNEKTNLIAIDHVQIKNIIYIPELALLNYSQQSNLINRFLNKENILIILASIYDPNILLANNIISKKMTDICLSERVVIPSLKKRSSDIPVMMDFLRQLKFNMPDPDSSQIKNLEYPENLDSFKKNLFLKKGIYSEPKSDTLINELYLSSLEGGLKLRDMVAELEISTIKHAHKKVGNSQNKIANFLEISRGSLQHKLRKYDINYIDWED